MRVSQWVSLCSLLVVVGCGKDKTTEVPCADDELWDHVSEICVPRDRPIGGGDTGLPDDEDTDTVAPSDTDLVEPDTSEPIDPNCDKDRDGYISVECGGDDCDDNDPTIHPDALEMCDEIDNNCNGVNNEGLRCTFYAHTRHTLHLLDPFAKTLLDVTDDLPNLQDIDTHPSGALLGVSFDGLYQYDDLRGEWFHVGGNYRNNGPSNPNGLAVDQGGRIFVTSEDELWEVDIVDGRPTLLGDLGGDYFSSGDCVVNKSDTLYVTSKHDPDTDWFLSVDRNTGVATPVGPIGFKNVFALTAAWGKMYGLTRGGEMVLINESTGEGTLVHTFPNAEFFGAASTPDR